VRTWDYQCVPVYGFSSAPEILDSDDTHNGKVDPEAICCDLEFLGREAKGLLASSVDGRGAQPWDYVP